MANIVFARPRTNYDSYRDLYKLIALSDFPLVYFDEIDPSSDNLYIMTMMNGENMHGFSNPRARIVLWDLEWREEPPAIPGVTELWASDRYYARLIGARYVPMGSHPDLVDDSALPDDVERGGYNRYLYDAAFIGYMIPRREQVSTWLRDEGVCASPIHAWGAERGFVMDHSKMYLHVHQHEAFPCIPSLRLVVAAAYRLPFVTETCTDAGVWANVVMQAHYPYLPVAVKQFAQPHMDHQREQMGQALYHAACEEFTFRRSVEQAA